MKKLKPRPVLVKVLVGVLGLAIGIVSVVRSVQKQDHYHPPTPRLTHPLFDFDEGTFYEGVNQAKEEDGSFTTKILGGVVPHHTLVGYMIADFFARLAVQQPKTIILLGPNHEETGSYQALTSTYGWETPFGVLGINQQTINALSQKDLVRVDDKSLENEPSIAALVPYLKYYLPEIEMVPLIFKSSFDLNDVNALGGVLAQMLNEKTVLVASVDFSHYLNSRQAQNKDVLTLEAMENFDLSKLLSLNSDYLDSPPAIAVLLQTMKEREKTVFEIIHHANSGELQNNTSVSTTSYFVLTF